MLAGRHLENMSDLHQQNLSKLLNIPVHNVSEPESSGRSAYMQSGANLGRYQQYPQGRGTQRNQGNTSNEMQDIKKGLRMPPRDTRPQTEVFRVTKTGCVKNKRQ